jgi:RND family efflux transporter MFP subunit
MMRAFSVWSTTVALIISVTGCAKHEAAPEVVRPVLTQKVEPTRAVDQTVYSGEVRARYETDLGFRIAGKIIERKVDVGAEVKKGTLLARLDPADARLNADAARAQVAAAETEFNYASSELARYKTLLDKGFIGESAFEAKQNSYNSAKAKLAAARSQAAVNVNQSEYTSLYADDDGVITAVTGEVGQVVSAGQPVMRLARPREKEVVINAAESRIAELRQSQQMLVRLWAYPDKILQGRVREIAPNADTTTRTFSVKVTLLDPGPEVKLGMTATVLAGGADANTLVLPLTAIYSQDGKAGVWVVDAQSGKVSLRNVEVGQYRENGVTIISGLNTGEYVVTAGVHKLIPGQVVRIAQPPGPETKS